MKKQHKGESYADFKERRKKANKRRRIRDKEWKWNQLRLSFTKTVWIGNLYFTHKECAEYLGITQKALAKKTKKGIPLKKM